MREKEKERGVSGPGRCRVGRNLAWEVGCGEQTQEQGRVCPGMGEGVGVGVDVKGALLRPAAAHPVVITKACTAAA